MKEPTPIERGCLGEWNSLTSPSIHPPGTQPAKKEERRKGIFWISLLFSLGHLLSHHVIVPARVDGGVGVLYQVLVVKMGLI